MRAALTVLVVGLAAAVPSAAQAQGFDQNGILFVHGFVGSGAQFESQKMRFTSNGYPQPWIAAIDYDTTFGTETRAQVHARIDQMVADLKQRTGRTKVDILGHSLGTSVMQDYLNSSPTRAANVEHYVNIDGNQAESPPGGVPTLAVWAGRGTPDRRIVGARNVTIPNQTHVEVATSRESFAEYYRFFTGREPATRDIVPQSNISVGGRALIFPQNRGLPAGASLEVWPVDTATGRRTSAAPVARFTLGPSGDFGPVAVEPGRRYEFVVLRPGVATLHYYHEPFVRSNDLIRLPYSDAVEAAVQRSERHTAGLILRYKELWGSEGAGSDVLSINGLNVCTPTLCPVSKQVNAFFFYDRGLDGRTDLSSPDPAFSRLPFITGADVFIPAARPPDGTVSVSLRSRGAGPVRSLNFPNFPSTVEGAVLQFHDFEEPATATVDSRAGCVPRRAAVSSRGIGRARLGGSFRAFVRRHPPARRGRRFARFCVNGGGRFLAAARGGRIDFVATTARGHRTRRHATGRFVRAGRIAGARRIHRRLRVAGGRGGGRVVYGVRGRRVRFIAVAPARQVASRRALLRRLRAAGLLARRR